MKRFATEFIFRSASWENKEEAFRSSFIHSFIRSFIHSFIHSFLYSFIYSHPLYVQRRKLAFENVEINILLNSSFFLRFRFSEKGFEKKPFLRLSSKQTIRGSVLRFSQSDLFLFLSSYPAHRLGKFIVSCYWGLHSLLQCYFFVFYYSFL